jgi:hypothetical protein
MRAASPPAAGGEGRDCARETDEIGANVAKDEVHVHDLMPRSSTSGLTTRSLRSATRAAISG